MKIQRQVSLQEAINGTRLEPVVIDWIFVIFEFLSPGDVFKSLNRIGFLSFENNIITLKTRP